MDYLDFEKPIEEVEQQLEKSRNLEKETEVDMSKSIREIEKRLEQTKKNIYKKLSPWQRVQLSRHPQRPYSLAYMEAMTGGKFLELHGDRSVKDDRAMVGGWGKLGEQPVMFVGQQKGINTKMRQYRNFGMANPEGYRKALRLMKMAEKFKRPVVTLIDTPGAFPGLEAEERGQGEAIARNIYEMSILEVPIICVVIGEGASGGALGIGVGDRVLMLENTWYSVISPESCSSILWRSWEYKQQAAEALKLTARDMLKNKLIDAIIEEPLGGAHRHPQEMFSLLQERIQEEIQDLQKLPQEELLADRLEKFERMGAHKN